MNPPKPCSGSSPQSSWNNQLLAFAISIQLRSGPDYNLIRSSKGVALDIQKRGGLGTPGNTYEQFIFISHGVAGSDNEDYISCAPPNAAPGTGAVWILKPPLCFFSITNRTARGTPITYSGWDDVAQSRVATNPFGTVTEFITPSYSPGDIIWATSVSFDDGSDDPPVTTLMSVEDPRTFCAP